MTEFVTVVGCCRLKVMSEELEEANTMGQQSPRMTQVLSQGTIFQKFNLTLNELGCVEFPIMHMIEE